MGLDLPMERETPRTGVFDSGNFFDRAIISIYIPEAVTEIVQWAWRV